jgi:hypothetical protein
MPMNSVMIVRALRMNRSMTLNAPQNLPNRSRISRACPKDDLHPNFLFDLLHPTHPSERNLRPLEISQLVDTSVELLSRFPGI